MNKVVGTIVLLISLVGCGEYIPSKIYEIKTTDGQTIKMYCPTIDRGRSEFSYFYDGRCILVKD